MEIAAGETVTGADGGFSVRFTAVPDEMLDPAMEPVFSYWVTAEVVDQAGEGGEAAREVCAGFTEYAAEVSADDWQEAGKPVDFEVETRTHDGEPFPAARCEANQAAGTITYLSGFDFAATASIVDVLVADSKGYYDELCLDVELRASFSVDNYPQVAANQAQFAILAQGSCGSHRQATGASEPSVISRIRRTVN